MTLIIISSFIVVVVLGFITIRRRYTLLIEQYNFASRYRMNFMNFVNKYFENFDSWNRRGNLDSDLYVWLTKNANRIQGDLGNLGTMDYVAPFQIYHIKNYQILINTIPKFRAGKVEDFDINSADDCLLRYIGILETVLVQLRKKMINPVIWFKEGFQFLISLPLYIFNWFGIVSDATVSKVTANVVFRLLAGVSGLVTFASGIVTIIQGKEQTVLFLKQFFSI